MQARRFILLIVLGLRSDKFIRGTREEENGSSSPTVDSSSNWRCLAWLLTALRLEDEEGWKAMTVMDVQVF
jgi:hypothetical protein